MLTNKLLLISLVQTLQKWPIQFKACRYQGLGSPRYEYKGDV